MIVFNAKNESSTFSGTRKREEMMSPSLSPTVRNTTLYGTPVNKKLRTSLKINNPFNQKTVDVKHFETFAGSSISNLHSKGNSLDEF